MTKMFGCHIYSQHPSVFMRENYTAFFQQKESAKLYSIKNTPDLLNILYISFKPTE